MPWLKPYTDDKIRQLGAQGVRKIVVVPVSFVSEHIETLEEIDMEYKELAKASGESLHICIMRQQNNCFDVRDRHYGMGASAHVGA